MKISVKAALWSAFAFPGAGHLMLRRYARGAALLGVTVAAIWYFLHAIMASGLIDKVNDLVYKMAAGEISSDPDVVDRMVARMLDAGPYQTGMDIASWLAFACWVAGIVDSYRIGLQQEREAKRAPEVQAR